MANHKRGKPKNSRSGCLMCKPWKINGASEAKGLKHSEQLQLLKERDDYEDDFEDVQAILDDDSGDFEQSPGSYDETATATAPPVYILGKLRKVARGPVTNLCIITIEEADGTRGSYFCGLSDSQLIPLIGKDIKAYFSLDWKVNYVTYEAFGSDQSP